MQYSRLGTSDLEVSKICLGCMSYGDPTSGNHSWSLCEDESRPFYKQALNAGINFFDTANVYSDGRSEEITGRALLSMARREDVVIATKVGWPQGANGSGLSAREIRAQLDASLRRLGTDYIDLYQIHRADPGTPWEETLEALHAAVVAGKVRWLGASSMYAWQFATSLYLADLHGWTRFVSMQDHYNLLYREEEREMLPLCLDQGVGVVPWSPLGRGRLTRPWSGDDATARSQSDTTSRTRYQDESSHAVVDAVGDVAAARGFPRARVALAWLLSRPAVTAPIIGATRLEHLEDAVAAVDVVLSADEIDALEKPYRPQTIAGH